MRDQRFDHHPPPKGDSDPESVWYASGSLIGAVAESFGRTGFLDQNCGRRICTVELTAPFDVVDFYGVGPRHLGLDQQICTTTDYGATQEWARALYLQFPDLVGIRWRGRQASSENVILTDRANLATLIRLSDHEVSETAVWHRIASAARKCKIRIV
ncbi:MAG: RES domain-containing protein [Deltaproteobacteria bacterium]|nr:RES domain-containing protein [Deltaproteobacteria bacterium]